MNGTGTKTVRLLALEKDGVFRCAYRLLPAKGPVDLIGVSASCDLSRMRHTLATLQPEALLLGTDTLESGTIRELEQFRRRYPRTGVLLFFLSCGAAEIDLLRRLLLKGAGGAALFLKPSLKGIDQILGIVLAVARRQTIIDPALANALFAADTIKPLLALLAADEEKIRLAGGTSGQRGRQPCPNGGYQQ